MAAKYEEIYPPEISEYLIACSNTKREIMRAEIGVSFSYGSNFYIVINTLAED